MESTARVTVSRMQEVAHIVKGLSIGVQLGMEDLRKLLSDPFIVDKTDVATFLDGALLMVALSGGIRTTMLWKISWDDDVVVLAKLRKEQFRCRKSGRKN